MICRFSLSVKAVISRAIYSALAGRKQRAEMSRLLLRLPEVGLARQNLLVRVWNYA